MKITVVPSRSGRDTQSLGAADRSECSPCASFSPKLIGASDGPGVQNEQLFWGNSNIVSFIKWPQSMAYEVRCDERHTARIKTRSGTAGPRLQARRLARIETR